MISKSAFRQIENGMRLQNNDPNFYYQTIDHIEAANYALCLHNDGKWYPGISIKQTQVWNAETSNYEI